MQAIGVLVEPHEAVAVDPRLVPADPGQAQQPLGEEERQQHAEDECEQAPARTVARSGLGHPKWRSSASTIRS